MKVLIIEDDPALLGFLKKGLAAEACIIQTADTGQRGISLAKTNTFDAIVLDFHLPDMYGDEIAQEIRKHKPSIPILMLSVEHSTDIKVDLLTVCDDYVTKPFSLRELIARLRALTRRGEILHDDIITTGTLTLNSRKHTVTLSNKQVTLRNKEFALLEYFMQHQDTVLSREVLLEHVWDTNTDMFTNTVDTHVRLLRKKLESKKQTFIHTIPKRGYRFAKG